MWRVLIVDDDSQIRQQLQQGLAKAADCIGVSNADDALKTFTQALGSDSPFDFVLLDVLLSEKKEDGFEVLRQIRACEEQRKGDEIKEVVVIMITTYKDSLMERYNMGWDDFITKPIEIEKLIRHMKTLSGE